MQGIMENDLRGLTFENQNRSGPPLTGDYILHQYFDVPTTFTKWEKVIVLFAMAVVYRLIFYVLIRASEHLIPSARAYSRRKSSNLHATLRKIQGKAVA